MQEPVAIVGVGLRFPGGAHDLESLWRILAEGRNVWSEVPKNRFNEEAFHHQARSANSAYSHHGGHFLEQDVAAFDAPFFGVSALEAKSMDPQQRILLEVTYEALESAGITLEAVKNSKTGTYIATFMHDYESLLYKDTTSLPRYSTTGIGHAMYSNKISYTFDLKGPSLTLDTGCSGSLVALDLACQSLQSGETSLAIVGGTNLILSPDTMVHMGLIGLLNENGRCFSFDERGSGYGRAEGVSVVVLKRLRDAVAANDPIHAVIRSTIAGSNGKTAGIMRPSETAQIEMIKAAYEKASLDPTDTGYIEAHGTGTKIGDVTEMNALDKVFSAHNRDPQPVYVGSIKANIGHTESTSGLAGLLKAVLVLSRELIPPVPGIETLKPNLKLDAGNLKIPQSLTPWPLSSLRRASINSFGYGGANSHAIIESLEVTLSQLCINKELLDGGSSSRQRKASSEGLLNGVTKEAVHLNKELIHNVVSPLRASLPRVFVLSGRSSGSLKDNARKLQQWMLRQPGYDGLFESLVYTLGLRRSHMQWRFAFAASSWKEVQEALEPPVPRTTRKSAFTKVTFVFTGQGAQWPGMAQELLAAFPVFLDSLKCSDEILRRLGAPWSLIEELLKLEASSRINNGEFSQPATTSVQLGLVDLYKHFNIVPCAVSGHSSGEIAAAYAAGAVTQEEAITIAYYRSFVSKYCRELGLQGSMLAVALSESDILPYLEKVQSGRAVVACVNSPSSTTISGDSVAIIELKDILASFGVSTRTIKVDTAYHSFHTKQVATMYQKDLEKHPFITKTTSTRFYSSVTASDKAVGFSPDYWVENLISKVRFHEALANLCTQFQDEWESSQISCSHVFLEIGPHGALTTAAKQTIGSLKLGSFQTLCLPAIIRGHNSMTTVLQSLASMWEQGVPMAIGNANSSPGKTHDPKLLSDLPSYSWDHSVSYWYEPRVSKEHRHRRFPYHDLLGVQNPRTTIEEPVWRHVLSAETLPWLKDHSVDGCLVFPATGYLAMSIEAKRQLMSQRHPNVSASSYVLRDIFFTQYLEIPDSPETVEVELSLRDTLGTDQLVTDWQSFRVYSFQENGSSVTHCRGMIRVEVSRRYHKALAVPERVRTLQRSDLSRIEPIALYQWMKENGNDWGPSFALIREFWCDNSEGHGKVEISDIREFMPGRLVQPHVVHPTIFDAILHSSLMIFARACDRSFMLPVSINEVRISSNIPNEAGTILEFFTTVKPTSSSYALTDIMAFRSGVRSDTEIPCIEIRGGELTGAAKAVDQERQLYATRDLCYSLAWEENFEAPSATPTSRTLYLWLTSEESVEVQCFVKYLMNNDVAEGRSISRVTDYTELDSAQDLICLVIGFGGVFPAVSSSLKTSSMLQETLGKTNKAVWINFETDDSHFLGRDAVSLHTMELPSSEFKMVRLDVDASTAQYNHSKLSDSILYVARKMLYPRTAEDSHERRYLFQHGQLLVPRLKPLIEASKWVQFSVTKELETTMFQHSERNLELRPCESKSFETLHFADSFGTNLADKIPQMEIQPLAYGVELNQALILGSTRSLAPVLNEFSGLIVSVPPKLRGSFRAGDHVCGFGGAPFSNRIFTTGDQVIALPSSLSYVQGASIPYSFSVAWHALVNIGAISSIQKVLIQDADSPLGQALVQIAHYHGTEIIATVARPSSKEFLMERYSISASHIIHKGVGAIKSTIDYLTRGAGVDLIICRTAAELLDDNLTSVAPFGQIIEITSSTVLPKRPLQLPSIDRNIVFATIDLQSLIFHRPQVVQGIMKKVMPLLEQGALYPPEPLQIMDLSQIDHALKLCLNPETTQKIILKISQDTCVKVTSEARKPLNLANDKTFLVINKQWIVAQAFVSFLVDEGARYIVLLGPDLGDSTKVQGFKDKMKLNGVFIENLIADSSSALSGQVLPKEFPALQGIIQCGISFNLNTWGTFSNLNLDFFISVESVTEVFNIHDTPDAKANTLFSFSPKIASLRKQELKSINLFIPEITTRDIKEKESQDAVSANNGFLRMSQLELYALLKFAIENVRLGNCTDIVVGFDRRSLESSQNAYLLKDPILYHLPSIGEEANAAQEVASKDVDELFLEAVNETEATNVVTSAIQHKIASFVSIEQDMVDLNTPLEEFGLDSLITFRFRNWLFQNFKASLEPGEISDSKSILLLASVVLQRSKVKAPFKDATKPTGEFPDDNEVSEANGRGRLPHQPLPPLEDTVRNHLDAIQHFCTADEIVRLKHFSKEFLSPNGPGGRLQDLLLETFKDSRRENWFSDMYLVYRYLRLRTSIMGTMSYYGTHPQGKYPHSQTERAAIIAIASLEFKHNLEHNKLETQYMYGRALDPELYQWLFNASREPREGEDVMRKYAVSNDIIVVCRGTAFLIELPDDLEKISLQGLKTAFDSINEGALKKTWLSILTTGNRDEWANLRTRILSLSDANKSSIETIERVAFVICLDNARPSNAEERFRQFLYASDGSNRWYDKTLQYIVCSNGESASLFEHSAIDGVSGELLQHFVHKAIQEHEPETTPPSEPTTSGTPSTTPPCKPLPITTDPTIDAAIASHRQNFPAQVSKWSFSFLELSTLSTSFLSSHRCPVQSGIQLALQLAVRRFFGYNPMARETVSLAHFRRGRVETNDIITAEILAFIAAVEAQRQRQDQQQGQRHALSDPKALQSKAYEAARSHAKTLSRASKGRGAGRHMLALEWMAKEVGGEVPELFRDEAYVKTKPARVLTSSFKTGWREGGFVYPVPGGILVYFEVFEESVKFSIFGNDMDAKEYGRLLEEAAGEVHDILSA